MPSLFSVSFEGNVLPAFDVRCLRPGQRHPDGWGIGFYPSGEPVAYVLKKALGESEGQSESVKSWDSLVSSIFMVQLRSARWGPRSDTNTQPFSRFYARRVWLLGHSGSLEKRFELREDARFEPVGSTDSEALQCELLERMVERGWRSFGDANLDELRSWYLELGQLGDLTSIHCDGRDMVVYADRGDQELYIATVKPPVTELAIADAALGVDLTQRGPLARKGVVVCSRPLESTKGAPLSWEKVPAGTLLVIREGAIRARIDATKAEKAPDGALVEPRAVRSVVRRPGKASPRLLRVTHHTNYRYQNPVNRSTHLFRLEPVHDRRQRLVSFDFDINVEGHSTDYEDVFSNRARRLHVETPFTEMDIRATSVVEVLDTDPLNFSPIHQSTTIPLLWMPWQREVLQPFLLPEELPDSQLWELSDYAMSFARRNDFDIVDTLLDMNLSIYREYTYRQGFTSVYTTPFEVYSNRAGVCQDFANLFITLARLLNVPARYVCGYIYCPPTKDNIVQSLESHAWVQAYLPEVGWLGLDPTNGVLTQTDHVRVAVGRNYMDATPTSGTLYEGGGGETLKVDVRVEILDEHGNPIDHGQQELPFDGGPPIAPELPSDGGSTAGGLPAGTDAAPPTDAALVQPAAPGQPVPGQIQEQSQAATQLPR